jgi:hypothetical protein
LDYNERFVSTINPMDSNISSTLTLRRQDAALDQLNVAGSDSTDIMQAPPAKSYRRPSFEGQGYSHPYGGSRSLRQLHDSAANSSEDLELSLFRPLSTNWRGTQANFVINFAEQAR